MRTAGRKKDALLSAKTKKGKKDKSGYTAELDACCWAVVSEAKTARKK